MLPFTNEQFLAVFADYNAVVWPAQVAAYVLAAVMLAALVMRNRWTGRIVGALFVVQSLLMAHVTVVRDGLALSPSGGARAWVGWLLVAYAAVLYPLAGIVTGHAYPAMPMFGITPCPVVIFTFGVFLLAGGPVSTWLLAVPFAWSLIGGSAAFLLNVPQDWVLLFSGIAALPHAIGRRKRPAPG